MNTISDQVTPGRRRRRTHSAGFKAKVVAACRAPGVSIAAVAMANGINANLARRWVLDDNNHCENQMRPWALGRKNWLFIGSQLAGERAAVVMSLLQSAKLTSQRSAAVDWHFGQRRLRHELNEIPWVLQPSQRKTCPPSAAVRHCSMADMTLESAVVCSFSWPSSTWMTRISVLPSSK